MEKTEAVRDNEQVFYDNGWIAAVNRPNVQPAETELQDAIDKISWQRGLNELRPFTTVEKRQLTDSFKAGWQAALIAMQTAPKTKEINRPWETASIIALPNLAEGKPFCYHIYTKEGGGRDGKERAKIATLYIDEAAVKFSRAVELTMLLEMANLSESIYEHWK